MKLLALLVVLAVSASAEKSRYDNYRVYSLKIENHQQLDAMNYLEKTSDSYEFFSGPLLNGPTDVLVAPHKFADFDEIVANFNIKSDLVINNYQQLIDDEIKPSRSRRNDINAQWDFTYYKNFAEINEWLDEMARTHSSVASIRTLGTTIEGRPIRLFSISKRSGNRAVYIEANIHAREWISSATASYFINELLTSTNPDIVDISTTVDWHIIVVANPDGFSWSWTNNRNWRKTRAPVSALCFGVDANRNFAYNWLVPDETGNAGASTTPCTDTYAGPNPHSENETRAIDSVFTSYNNIDLFLSFHSYGHYLLHPWGHSRNNAPDYAILTTVGQAFRTGLLAVDNIGYTVGSSNQVLYAASGTTPDHAYGHHGITLAYTIEMRGNGRYGNYGFVLPPELININAQEVTAGLVAMIKSAKSNGFF